MLGPNQEPKSIPGCRRVNLRGRFGTGTVRPHSHPAGGSDVMSLRHSTNAGQAQAIHAASRFTHDIWYSCRRQTPFWKLVPISRHLAEKSGILSLKPLDPAPGSDGWMVGGREAASFELIPGIRVDVGLAADTRRAPTEPRAAAARSPCLSVRVMNART